MRKMNDKYGYGGLKIVFHVSKEVNKLIDESIIIN